MKQKSVRYQLIKTTSLVVMSVIVVFSLVILVYLGYYMLIIGKIYAMDDDLFTPIAKVVIVLLIVLLIMALLISVVCGVMISKHFLQTVDQFRKNIQQIKSKGLNHRLLIEGDDELAKLGIEFNEAIDLAERSLQQQNRFVSDASHELKTPLAIIKGNLDMLRRWGKNDQKILDNSLEVTYHEVERLSSLCNELLHLTRDMDTRCNQAIDLELIINDVVADFKKLHPEFTYLVEVKEKQLIWIKEEHLRQLLIILIDNAIKYSREDSHKIKIGLQNTNLWIKDYGIGIDDDKISKIFDRFYRVDEARVQNDNSFGLGLAIAKRICNYYDFKIEVVSQLNKYTQFKINLERKK